MTVFQSSTTFLKVKIFCAQINCFIVSLVVLLLSLGQIKMSGAWKSHHKKKNNTDDDSWSAREIKVLIACCCHHPASSASSRMFMDSSILIWSCCSKSKVNNPPPKNVFQILYQKGLRWTFTGQLMQAASVTSHWMAAVPPASNKTSPLITRRWGTLPQTLQSRYPHTQKLLLLLL